MIAMPGFAGDRYDARPRRLRGVMSVQTCSM
jgi:hypothetical protein